VFDLDQIDKLYDAQRQIGAPIAFRLFDKRALLPLVQLPAAVKSETGESIGEGELRAKAAAGWYPLLRGAGFDGNDEGAPLYAPSRIGLFLKLDGDGYDEHELRLMAEHEEWAIDNMYTVDEMAYVDDDLEALILHLRSELDGHHHVSGGGPELEAQRQERAERTGRDLAALEGYRRHGIPEAMRPVIEKAVFRARAVDDMVRMMLLDMERAKVQAGYSPYIVCRKHKWSLEDGFGAEGVLWQETLAGIMAYAQAGEAPPLRVPGFVLRGDRVTPVRTLRPADYSALWKQHDLDEYLEAWSKANGERRCLNCFATLPVGNDRKRFCGDKCRNAARQRRFRERNPEAVERAQKRYWDSIKIEGV
jgi:hypothetical protein